MPTATVTYLTREQVLQKGRQRGKRRLLTEGECLYFANFAKTYDV